MREVRFFSATEQHTFTSLSYKAKYPFYPHRTKGLGKALPSKQGWKLSSILYIVKHCLFPLRNTNPTKYE